MDNFRLTTKEEVLDYLSNKKIALNREKKIAYIKGVLSLSGFGSSCMIFSSFIEDSLLSVATEHPLACGICFLGGMVFSELSYHYIGDYALCCNQLNENDKMIKWVKNRTLQKNTLRNLENEVVAARQSNFSKVKSI